MNFNKDKYCSQECEEMHSPEGVCDFCNYYDFNGNENGTYTGEGYCNLLKDNREPYEGCKEFICRKIE